MTKFGDNDNTRDSINTNLETSTELSREFTSISPEDRRFALSQMDAARGQTANLHQVEIVSDNMMSAKASPSTSSDYGLDVPSYGPDVQSTSFGERGDITTNGFQTVIDYGRDLDGDGVPDAELYDSVSNTVKRVNPDQLMWLHHKGDAW